MRAPRSIPLDVLNDPGALYDFFMSTIEPELLRKNLDTLDAPYSKETAEERAIRYGRYSSAMIVLKDLIEEFSADAEHQKKMLAMSMDMGAVMDDMDAGTKTLSDLDDQINAQS